MSFHVSTGNRPRCAWLRVESQSGQSGIVPWPAYAKPRRAPSKRWPGAG